MAPRIKVDWKRGLGLNDAIAERAIAERPDWLARVFANIQNYGDPDSCWLWMKACLRSGYGVTATPRSVTGRNVALKVHRLVWIALRGPIPVGLQLDHLCRVRQCANPAHLEPVTPSVNVLRSTSPRQIAERNRTRGLARTACRNGHEFTADNTGRDPDGHRVCRACAREATRRYHARKV